MPEDTKKIIAPFILPSSTPNLRRLRFEKRAGREVAKKLDESRPTSTDLLTKRGPRVV